MEWLDQNVKLRIWIPSLVIKIEDSLQSSQAAIVHIGDCLANLAEGGRLKGATIFEDARHAIPTHIAEFLTIPANAQIMKESIAEIETLVAELAMSLSIKQVQSSKGFLIERRFVSSHVLIVR